MSVVVQRLGASDFEEAMSLLDRVFGEYRPHDFRRMLPSVYRPTEDAMGRNLAVRQHGRIAALLGVFPATWQVGDTALPLARIGGVAVAPEQRGRGWMRRLMAEALQWVQEGRYPLAFLAGNRWLYARFGFERAGTELRVHLLPRDITAALGGSSGQRVQLRRMKSPISAELLAWHACEPLRCRRLPEDFVPCLSAWHREPLAALDGQGKVVGYLTGSTSEGLVTELAAGDVQTGLGMLERWCQGRPVTWSAAPLPSPRLGALLRLADHVQAVESGSWRVLDWPTVLGSLLAALHCARPLPHGRAVIGVEGEPQSLGLEVTAAGTSCVCGSTEPARIATPGVWLRALTGPSGSIEFDFREVPMLAAWRPLPLWLSPQDQV
ncbi:GNAT family N-acetyltransferase [Myxococcota bacterium]